VSDFRTSNSHIASPHYSTVIYQHLPTSPLRLRRVLVGVANK
jgi:hypothetical protein